MTDFATLEKIKTGKNNGDGLAALLCFARALHRDEQSRREEWAPWSLVNASFQPANATSVSKPGASPQAIKSRAFSPQTPLGDSAAGGGADEVSEEVWDDALEAYGAAMKEYVAVADGLLGKTRELARNLDLSFAYVGTLKAKSTTKNKSG